MSNFRDRYKQKRGGPNDAATGRMTRAHQQDERRRNNRAETFSRYRDVSPSFAIEETQETANLDDRFRRWKLEKDMRKKMDQKNKKPIFKVGIVHHKFYSPVSKDKIDNNAPCHSREADQLKTRQSPLKRITRATQKRLAAKMASSMTATSFQPGTSGTARSTTPFQASTSAAAACMIPSQPGTSGAAPSTSPSQPSTSAAAPCATPFQPGTSTPAAPVSSLSNVMAASACASFTPPYAFNGPMGVQGTPMFGSLAVSKDFTPESAHSSKLEAREASPWSSTHNFSVASESLLKKRKRFVQQNAIESLSWSGMTEQFSSPEDSLEEEKRKKIELYSRIDATTSQPVAGKDITVIETLTCSDSPSPAMFSSYVKSSRGKDGVQRERRSKMKIGCTPPDDVPTKETVTRSLKMSVEEDERTAQYFKFILQREIERLNEICAKWEKVKGEPGLTEDARYLINQAIGQTTLLVRKKFERFRSLVADYETGKGEMLVQCRDLQGFWDMTYVEVKNCDSRFKKLDQLQSTGWIEEEIVATTKRPKRIRNKVVANKFMMNAKSSARSWILAKRKTMSQTEESGADVISVRRNSEESKPATSGNTDSTPREKTRHSVGSSPRTVPRSAKRPGRKITPKQTPVSLLKKVQLSETKKNGRSPLTVMKISQICEIPDIRLDETISYINSDQTPGRGILKKSVETSTCKVDFNDDVFPSQPRTDGNLEKSIDLGCALVRIKSYDSDSSDDVFEPEDVLRTNVTLRGIEKGLDFERESISDDAGEPEDVSWTNVTLRRTKKRLDFENASVSEKSFAFPEITITAPTPSIYASTSGAYPSIHIKALERSTFIAHPSNEENISADASSTRRVLRNRSVSVRTPKQSARRSRKSSSAREKIVRLDSSAKENDNPQIPRQRNFSESSRISDIEWHSEEPSKIRRSTKKSVRFDTEDCIACADSTRPAHPMTPYSHRSRKISLLGDVSRQSIGPQFDGDLISFDSPALPSRISRTPQASRKSSQ